MSIRVDFYDEEDIDEQLCRFAVVVARYQDHWIYCRHKERSTYEIPGGHRETGEDILATAKRELYEETGAVSFDINPVCVYSVTREEATSYGMLYYAEVYLLGELPQDMEIGEIILVDTPPSQLTYPDIQPYLFERILLYNKHVNSIIENRMT